MKRNDNFTTVGNGNRKELHFDKRRKVFIKLMNVHEKLLCHFRGSTNELWFSPRCMSFTDFQAYIVEVAERKSEGKNESDVFRWLTLWIEKSHKSPTIILYHSPSVKPKFSLHTPSRHPTHNNFYHRPRWIKFFSL